MTDGVQILRQVRLPDGQAVDLDLAGGRIQAIHPAGQADPALPTVLDGGGQLLLPAFVEAHTHLDKTLWGLPWRPNSAGPTRNDRIRNEQVLLRDFPVPPIERAGPLLEHCIAMGSLAVRTHVDIQTLWGLRHVHAMLELRARYGHLVDLQLVAFPQGGMLVEPGTVELMDEAMALGVDLVGGIDPAAIDRDPIRHLETIFGLAVKHGRGVDIHLHDLGELGRWEIERIADFTEAHGLQGRVMISHGYCLGQFPPADLHALLDRLAALRIAVMTCGPAHFSVPPAAVLRSRGVTVCSGSDGIRDAWSPMGNGDMLERAWLLALRYGWSKDEDLRAAFDIVTAGGAQALGLEGRGLAPGCVADLVVLPAENLPAAILERPRARTVLRGGRVVARDGHFLGL